jgi:predicted alpha/beta hydrolase family esterase
MSTVFIIHGIGGNPKENWFPWMKKEIESEGHRVIVPDFPNSDEPRLDEWMEHMKKYEDSIDEETIFIGHSLGGMFILRLLEHMKKPIKAVFLVAGVTGPTDGLNLAPLMTTFTTPPLEYELIKKNGGTIQMLHADNDPYISLKNAETLARKLGAIVDVIKDGGHLNASAGYTTFPLLRESILSIS